MDIKDFDTLFEGWFADVDFAVKSPWPHQRRIEDVRTVGRCDDNYTTFIIKTIHLCEYLVEGLLLFLMAACRPATSFLTDCIDLIDKDDTCACCFGFAKEISDFGCAESDKHLHKF